MQLCQRRPRHHLQLHHRLRARPDSCPAQPQNSSPAATTSLTRLAHLVPGWLQSVMTSPRSPLPLLQQWPSPPRRLATLPPTFCLRQNQQRQQHPIRILLKLAHSKDLASTPADFSQRHPPQPSLKSRHPLQPGVTGRRPLQRSLAAQRPSQPSPAGRQPSQPSPLGRRPSQPSPAGRQPPQPNPTGRISPQLSRPGRQPPQPSLKSRQSPQLSLAGRHQAGPQGAAAHPPTTL